MTCGLEVTILQPDHRYPDSIFVEDTALLTPQCAILTNPGAPSRKGETEGIASVIRKYYSNIEVIEPPGTLDAGDIMMVGSHYYIGLSDRTNMAGAEQIINILERYELSGSTVALQNVLHLKTGVSYLENENLLVSGEFINTEIFNSFNVIPVEPAESYAANSVWINGWVIMPAGFPNTLKSVKEAGYKVLEVNTSEFQKLDGGISCLSLRF
jgi:dimethylargininase